MIPEVIMMDDWLVFGDWLEERGMPLVVPFDGLGYGLGDGDGYGYGLGLGTNKGDIYMPIVGERMIIVTGFGWVWCGDVVEQVSPFCFRIENAVNICRTGGTPWPELADGKGRDEAKFQSWGTITLGPSFIACREWKGELPT